MIQSERSKGAFGRGPSTLVVNSRVDKIYEIVRKSTGALGGNGYDGAIYGELTMHSMQKLINIFIEKCEMTSKSRFIDVGSGLGNPTFMQLRILLLGEKNIFISSAIFH